MVAQYTPAVSVLNLKSPKLVGIKFFLMATLISEPVKSPSGPINTKVDLLGNNDSNKSVLEVSSQ